MSQRISAALFCPQNKPPGTAYLDKIRRYLHRNEILAPFVQSILELSEFWDIFARQNEGIAAMPQGPRYVRNLRDWIADGNATPLTETMSGIVALPLLTIIQIAQYFQYLECRQLKHSQLIEELRVGGAQGYCGGLLPVMAIAASSNEEELVRNAAISVRIALGVGAYGELGDDENVPGPTTVVLRLNHAGQADDIVNKFPGAYISAITDPVTVSIVGPVEVLKQVKTDAEAKGLSVTPLNLRGKVHNPENADLCKELCQVCDRYPSLTLPKSSELLVPVRSNKTGKLISDAYLTHEVVESTLMARCEWYSLLTAMSLELSKANNRTHTFMMFGVGRKNILPLAPFEEKQLNVLKADVVSFVDQHEMSRLEYPEHAVAVIGMACKFPEADSVSEFWKLLTDGTSALQQMPLQRFDIENLQRNPNSDLKFWGNFVRDIDAFDHRFFKKSSREAASMDPQQRFLLEVAYQAMESSGHYRGDSAKQPMDIGCYIGVCSSDYNDNVASHPSNAFSSLGTLRAFLSGKISHFFGWTGPSITFDTACSSSAVAIHTAYQAIQSGECSQAVAGGVALYTSPYFYQNLATASFLSPTGACKPFDAKADGYCRGEGAGLVVLKKLSAALKDGDNIIGVLAGTAVNQNYNSTYITVPHSQSQIELYRKVSSLAGVAPGDVTHVEAHGTGTPVGDPIEFESIRQVFGGKQRDQQVYVSSVKGNIGHLEGASGIAALIKTLLMIQHKTIPIQASFDSLNPKILPLAPDKMAIPLVTQPWNVNSPIACINNYGAAGSNAAMIVRGPPTMGKRSTEGRIYLPKYPIFIAANSTASLSAYCTALRESLAGVPASKDLLADVSFSLCRTQNHSLPHALATTVSDFAELDNLLARGAEQSSVYTVPSTAKPLVLVFGGQTNNKIALSQNLYESSTLFRSHLDFCDSTMRSYGLPGLYPAIFQTEPIDNIVQLHSALFSLQYSCAKTFMDSGLHVDAVIGHSFGQLTALVVCGSLSFSDGLRLVSGRASLMETSWGPEQGSMLAVEADTDTVLKVISSLKGSSTETQLEIACYNGPTSHVIVGSEASILALQNVLTDRSIRNKKLDVTHGFHSVFTEPLLPGLTEIAEGITFHDPVIPLESCTNDSSWVRASPSLIAEHTRTPVYFHQAVSRLEQRLGACTWLEAGSASSVINMVRRALANEPSHVLQGIQLNTNEGTSLMADVTINLWKAGHGVQFWPFHYTERQKYSILQLPPYQFEKTRHWLNWVDTSKVSSTSVKTENSNQKPALMSFRGTREKNPREAEFWIDPNSEEYDLYVRGHAVLANPLCPAPLYVELVSKAALNMATSNTQKVQIPTVENLEIKAPLGKATERQISLVLVKSNDQTDSWTFTFSSFPKADAKAADTQSHATGRVTLRVQDSSLAKELARYERLAGIDDCLALKEGIESEAIQGSMIYKTFSKVVTYADYYMGVKSVHARNNKVTADIRLPTNTHIALDGTVTEPLAVDNFIQVAGLHVNSLRNCPDKEVLVCTQVDQILPSSKFYESRGSRAWTVYSTCSAANEQQVINDIFVFDSVTNELVFIVLGAHFTRVLISSLTKVLNRANNISHSAVASAPVAVAIAPLSSTTERPVVTRASVAPQSLPSAGSVSQDIAHQIRLLLHRVADVPMDTFTDDDQTLEDLGVDSLMITEVMNEISGHFEIEISASDFAAIQTVKALQNYLISRGCGTINASPDSDSVSTSPSANSVARDDLTPQTSFSNVGPDMDAVILKLTKLVGGNLETSSPLTRQTNLADEGLDSLLWIELVNEIKSAFGNEVNVSDISGSPTFGELLDLVLAQLSVAAKPSQPTTSSPTIVSASGPQFAQGRQQGQPATLNNAQQAFETIRYDYDLYTRETGFSEFWSTVYPAQAKLVLAYTVEAFSDLGCSLSTLHAGDRLPQVQCLAKHSLELAQLYNILQDAGLIVHDGDLWIRTEIPVDPTPSGSLLGEILQNYPQHASEHRLLHITASKLAACLTGSTDPLHLLFRRKEDKELLEDVYTNGPMYAAITKLLGSFLKTAYVDLTDGSTINILELGGGTGGTTKYIVDFLMQQGIPFTYTFTDLSGSLVTAARKKFASPNMEFTTLDIEQTPPDKFMKHFHTIISTNCIHATSDLVKSCTHIRQMLRPDGFLSLVEFTRNMYWFDLVFGLLDGWWLFKDGRHHVLADEDFWSRSMRDAGFNYVTWTDGPSEEAKTLRIITGFVAEPESPAFVPKLSS